MKKILPLLLLGVVAVVGITVAVFTLSSKKNTTTPAGTAPVQTNITHTPFMVPFDYQVTSVTGNEILLDGQKGRLVLPKDANAVKVFRGNPPGTAAAIGDLKVGQKIKLELVPGQSATVFILQ